MRRSATMLCAVGLATIAAVSVGSATESSTIFDRLHQLDAAEGAERQRAALVGAQVELLDEELDVRWTSLDVSQRAARPIRNQVTEGLARWLAAHRTAQREAMDGPHAGADTRRLLGYAAPRALPSRMRDVDVVRRADSERAGFAEAMQRRAQWSVELARTRAGADGAGGARDALIDEARAGHASADLDATAAEFEAKIAQLPPSEIDVDFHRFKGTLARPIPMRPDVHFGAQVPLMRPSGWTYRPQRGADVHAIGAGVVVFSGVVQGWGLVLAIDHGRGYLSAYGHLESSSVEPGARVERATVIGAAGDSGSLDGVRLYFELRKDGSAIDPADWFLK